ncbi:hypothetical protein GP486_004837 [Trichoglossum hirsutum]|uniref:Transmembrane 9 superfamily member n=1 Tax=Trichoglossum hirsutum TaxID=265104 RepID=A0A9P8LAE1_9PEZI|nr:hypothetical protein GP486_004837 [Trichoglossum hirsutum]
MGSQSYKSSAALIATLLVAPNLISAFYLPGVAPTSYRLGSRVPLNVNHLTPGSSPNDESLRSVVSLDYYHPAFHFCRPENGTRYISESLGSILFGDRISTSPFELYMGKDESCKKLCSVTFDAPSASFVNVWIWQNYNLNFLIDGLPAGQLNYDNTTSTEFYSSGFALGSVNGGEVMLHNHYSMTIDYHEVKTPGRGGMQYRVVGVDVRPSSRGNSKALDDGNVDCGSETVPLTLSEQDPTPVTWTYSVHWNKSPTAWATRWDKYLHVFDPRIHWFSLFSSTLIVVLLVGMVAVTLLRALRKDIARYNQVDQYNLDELNGTSAALEDGVQEDSGWKLVHGDVFRAPKYPLLLSIFLGSGAQLFVMTGITIVFALLGFLSPSNRGSLGTVMILLYAILAFIGGYVSSRCYKTFGGEAWKRNIIFTPTLIPGIVFGTFFFFNLFLWAQPGSSGAVPFFWMLLIVGIWFVISLPLSFAGSWVGFKQPPISPPVRNNQIPRQIPHAPTYLRPIPSMLLVGILPFGAIGVELYFILNSIWVSKIYYMFGFLFLCYGLMVITCAASTILMIYFLLCAENYHWRWRAFFTAGSCAAYIFLYAMFNWVSKMSLGGLTSNMLYIGYSALISFLFFVMTGTIGFFATWAFVQKIYGSIKID